jgi:hypothetical protein
VRSFPKIFPEQLQFPGGQKRYKAPPLVDIGRLSSPYAAAPTESALDFAPDAAGPPSVPVVLGNSLGHSLGHSLGNQMVDPQAAGGEDGASSLGRGQGMLSLMQQDIEEDGMGSGGGGSSSSDAGGFMPSAPAPPVAVGRAWPPGMVRISLQYQDKTVSSLKVPASLTYGELLQQLNSSMNWNIDLSTAKVFDAEGDQLLLNFSLGMNTSQQALTITDQRSEQENIWMDESMH